MNIVDGWLCHGSDDWRFCECGHDEQQHEFGDSESPENPNGTECNGDVYFLEIKFPNGKKRVSQGYRVCSCTKFTPIHSKSEFKVKFTEKGDIWSK